MLDNSHLCHCRMCQKAVGNVFAALVAAPNPALTFTRGEPAIFRSSEHVERGFCERCGTPLFYRGNTGRTNLTIGSLDDPSDFPPIAEVGTEARVSWLKPLPDVEDGGQTESAGQEAWAAAIRVTNRQHPDHDTDEWPNG
nr:GFA family protein [Croceibacterium sp. D39]